MDILDIIDRRKLEKQAFAEIRKKAVNPYNRIRSIMEDADFVKTVKKRYQSYPLVPNLRCGAWYVDPKDAGQASAYFKSADGHYNSWTFNLRRPNLHILPLIVRHQGIIIVDSTRAGKKIPDALSKTIPIWCTVINKALRLQLPQPPDNEWDTALYTPVDSVSRQEHVQIESKLDQWAELMAASSYELPYLKRPLRPIWIDPSSTAIPQFRNDCPFFPVLCVSASKLVEDGLERRQQGYTYVQGSGDDEEFWSMGLTPAMLWAFKDELLRLSEDDVAPYIEELIRRPSSTWTRPPTPIKRVQGTLCIAANSDLPQSPVLLCGDDTEAERMYHLVLRFKSFRDFQALKENHSELPLRASDSVLVMNVVGDKKSGEGSLRSQLPLCLRFIEKHLRSEQTVYISCDTGKDLSVVVTVAALQSFFDDEGQLILYDKSAGGNVSKETLRTRLEWVIASRPEANPARSSLKRLNEFFLSPPV